MLGPGLMVVYCCSLKYERVCLVSGFRFYEALTCWSLELNVCSSRYSSRDREQFGDSFEMQAMEKSNVVI